MRNTRAKDRAAGLVLPGVLLAAALTACAAPGDYLRPSSARLAKAGIGQVVDMMGTGRLDAGASKADAAAWLISAGYTETKLHDRDRRRYPELIGDDTLSFAKSAVLVPFCNTAYVVFLSFDADGGLQSAKGVAEERGCM